MTTDTPKPMTPDEIFSAWRNFDYALPKAALKSAIAQREAITPRLLQQLGNIADHPDSLLYWDGYYPGLYALYLLAWFRDPGALAPLRRMLDKKEWDLWKLWGDEILEDAPRLFASWVHGNPDLLKPFIEARPLNDGGCADLVNGAALEAYIVLYHAGAVSPEGMRPYLRHLADAVLRREADGPDGWIWYSWARCCIDLGLDDMYPLVKQAFEEEWVNPTIATWESVEKDLHAGREAVLEQSRRELGGLIDDPVAELGGWYCFTEEARLEDMRHDLEEAEFAPPPPGEIHEPFYHPDTIVNTAPKPKPNQPCPCGSGKKYKKCCGRK